MTIYVDFQHSSFHTLENIPKNMLVPQETQYALARVIFYDGLHFRGISLDAKNSHGHHLINDGMYCPANNIQIIKMGDPISKYALGYKILDLWYVKIDTSSAASGSASPSTAIKPVGITSLGHPSYLPSSSSTFPSQKPGGNQILDTPVAHYPGADHVLGNATWEMIDCI